VTTPALLDITDNIDDVVADLTRLEREQSIFAAAVTITRVTKLTEAALRENLEDTFDKLTPFAGKGTFSTSATKRELTAEVGMRDKGGKSTPALYMREHFSGRERGAKPFERVFQRIGFLPDGYRAIPGNGMKLDGFGNPNRRQLGELIKQLKSGWRVFQGKGKRQSLVGYFVVTPERKDKRTEHLIPGIWRRIQKGKDSAVIPVFVFVPKADYGKVIDIEKIANETIRRVFAQEFSKAIAHAMRTAK
jgi:hypothetical protein